jgi:arginyl-tRNA synthetase
VKSSDIFSLIEIPPENIPGDVAFPCFQISKTLKKSPNIIAQELATRLSSFNKGGGPLAGEDFLKSFSSFSSI